ncbi:MAG: hypothetical protein EOL97_07140 [Spirochaetia bacterium]|nr:hypothetical protein [Spirochaetia bacterium]
MERNDYEIFKNKKVIIELRSGYRYTGFVQSVNDFGIIVLDKFNKNISVSFDNIIRIEEVGE